MTARIYFTKHALFGDNEYAQFNKQAFELGQTFATADFHCVHKSDVEQVCKLLGVARALFMEGYNMEYIRLLNERSKQWMV